jgi:hypothetical protein
MMNWNNATGNNYYAGGADPYQDIKMDYGVFWKGIFPISTDACTLQNTINAMTAKLGEIQAHSCGSGNSAPEISCRSYVYNSARALGTILVQYNNALNKLGGCAPANNFYSPTNTTTTTTTTPVTGSDTNPITSTTTTIKPSSNMPLIIGGSIAGFLLVVGLIYAFSHHKK